MHQVTAVELGGHMHGELALAERLPGGKGIGRGHGEVAAHGEKHPALAGLHAFNGWADKFTNTPAAGLDDRYLGIGGNFGREHAGARAAWQIAWHDYRATHGSVHYGSEWNASLGLPLAKGVSALLKLADYRADRYARDTRKLWLQVEYKGGTTR